MPISPASTCGNVYWKKAAFANLHVCVCCATNCFGRIVRTSNESTCYRQLLNLMDTDNLERVTRAVGLVRRACGRVLRAVGLARRACGRVRDGRSHPASWGIIGGHCRCSGHVERDSGRVAASAANGSTTCSTRNRSVTTNCLVCDKKAFTPTAAGITLPINTHIACAC